MADALDLTEIARRTVQASAKFYKGWFDLSVEYFRGISEIFAEADAPAPGVDEAEELDPLTGVLVLEGEEGSTVRGAFLVTNDLGRIVSCEFVTSEFTDPDGASLHAKAVFDPPKLDLEPGEQRVVQAMISVDGKLTAGVPYSGEIAIQGLKGFTVPVVLRRLHRVEDSRTGQDPADRKQASRKPGIRRTTGREAAPKKTARKTAKKAGKKTGKKTGKQTGKKAAPRAKKAGKGSSRSGRTSRTKKTGGKRGPRAKKTTKRTR